MCTFIVLHQQFWHLSQVVVFAIHYAISFKIVCLMCVFFINLWSGVGKGTRSSATNDMINTGLDCEIKLLGCYSNKALCMTGFIKESCRKMEQFPKTDQNHKHESKIFQSLYILNFQPCAGLVPKYLVLLLFILQFF